MIAEFGLRIADLISAAADGWTECLGSGGLSTGGSGDSGEGVELGELRDSAGVAFSRVEVAVDAGALATVMERLGFQSLRLFLLYSFCLSFYLCPGVVCFARSGFLFLYPERSP